MRSMAEIDQIVLDEGHARTFNRYRRDTMTTKETNPKDLIGSGKASITRIPQQVLGEVTVALTEGAAKYGPYNWRPAGARTGVYIDATWRHLAAFWEGQDIDPDSGLSHVTKAIAGLIILRDSMLIGNAVDDRPPAVDEGWLAVVNLQTAGMKARYAETPVEQADPERAFVIRQAAAAIKCANTYGDVTVRVSPEVLEELTVWYSPECYNPVDSGNVTLCGERLEVIHRHELTKDLEGCVFGYSPEPDDSFFGRDPEDTRDVDWYAPDIATHDPSTPDEAPEQWVPEEGDKYWTVACIGENYAFVDTHHWCADSYDEDKLLEGLVFRTETEAQAAMQAYKENKGETSAD